MAGVQKEQYYVDLIGRLKRKEAPLGRLTLGEVIDLAEEFRVKASDVVIAEAMEAQRLTSGEVIQAVFEAFKFNLLSLEMGISKGESFLLGGIGRKLSGLKKKGTVLIGDRFIDNAVIYTLAAEVGNHQMGLQPCAGTGDSCVTAGLMKALLETRLSKLRIGQIGALII